jgi:mutator protein MutT
MKTTVYQAGAITFRRDKGELKILLIRSKKNPSRWIFPKGHIELNETEQQACVRELLEEAGVEGEIVEKAGDLEFMLNEKSYKVAYYLCRYLKRSGEGEAGRSPKWFGVEKAIEKLYFANSRELLSASLKKLNYITIKQI